MSDAGERYVAKTQRVVVKDTQWTVEQLLFESGHKSVSASIWHDLLLKFGVSKEDRIKIMKNLGQSLLDELENLFWSY